MAITMPKVCLLRSRYKLFKDLIEILSKPVGYLELRQYKNNSFQSEKNLILKSSLFSSTIRRGKKRGNFNIGICLA